MLICTLFIDGNCFCPLSLESGPPLESVVLAKPTQPAGTFHWNVCRSAKCCLKAFFPFLLTQVLTSDCSKMVRITLYNVLRAYGIVVRTVWCDSAVQALSEHLKQLGDGGPLYSWNCSSPVLDSPSLIVYPTLIPCSQGSRGHA